MKAHYLPMISGDEQDVFSRKVRHALAGLDRAGVARKAKRGYARRIRQDGRKQSREALIQEAK